MIQQKGLLCDTRLSHIHSYNKYNADFHRVVPSNLCGHVASDQSTV